MNEQEEPIKKEVGERSGVEEAINKNQTLPEGEHLYL